MIDIEANKATVLAFNDLMFNQGRPREAADRYMAAEFVEHNPNLRDGKEGFVEFFEADARNFPGKRCDVVRVIAEGDFVVLHWRENRPGRPETAGIDIYRLADGRIAEHWDVVQEIPAQSLNKNTMF